MNTPPSQPLRILHVVISLAAEVGGPSAVCAGLTSALAARGHRVEIATLTAPNQSPLSLPSEIPLHQFPIDGSPRYATSNGLDAWLRAKVANFDIVHIHAIWQFHTFAAARACWKAGTPYIITPHGMLEHYSVHQHSSLVKTLYWHFREKKIESRAAALHCLNAAEIHKAVPWIAGMPKFILPNGIDAAQLTNMPPRGKFRAAHPELADKLLALFLSRLHPKKGLDRLIPAWKAVVEKLPESRLLIAGTGEPDYVTTLQTLVKTNHLEKHILFLGQLTGTPKWQALVDADVFVLPSHQEGFSMAITEALAAGAPPVVTAECNFDELAPPSGPPAGVVIAEGDMAAFAAAAADLLRNPENRAPLIIAGKQMVANRYTWQTIAKNLESAYRRIKSGYRFPPSGEMLGA